MMFETRTETIISTIVVVLAIVVMLMDLFVWRP
jgi:preprotein translocase subunit SecE